MSTRYLFGVVGKSYTTMPFKNIVTNDAFSQATNDAF